MTRVRQGMWLALAILLLLAVDVSAQPSRVPVMVDTDMDLDDVRAIALLLNSPSLQVKALVTSDGALSPRVGADNLLRVLKFMGLPEIPVGVGKNLKKSPPRWRPDCQAQAWENLPAVPPDLEIPKAVSVIIRTLLKSNSKISYICLGPLSNLAAVLRQEPRVRPCLDKILYYGTPPGIGKPSCNTGRDLEAAAAVFTSGIPIFSFHLSDSQLLRFNLKLFRAIHRLNSRAARLIILLYCHRRIKQLLRTGNLRAWDETIPLYLNHPSLGNFQRLLGKCPIFILSSWDRKAARKVYLELLAGGAARLLRSRNAAFLTRHSADWTDLGQPWSPSVANIMPHRRFKDGNAAQFTN